MSDLTGLFEAVIMITHTPVDDGSHQGMARADGQVAGQQCARRRCRTLVAARQFQESSRLAFMQDFEVWTNKGPCLNGLFLPSDGPFMKARIWYKQFYNPRANKHEYLDQCEGKYVPRGMVAYGEAQ